MAHRYVVRRLDLNRLVENFSPGGTADRLRDLGLTPATKHLLAGALDRRREDLSHDATQPKRLLDLARRQLIKGGKSRDSFLHGISALILVHSTLGVARHDLGHHRRRARNADRVQLPRSAIRYEP